MLGVNQNGYNPPDGFCFDQYCADQPVMDDPTLHDYNLDHKIQLFIKRATDQVILVFKFMVFFCCSDQNCIFF